MHATHARIPHQLDLSTRRRPNATFASAEAFFACHSAIMFVLVLAVHNSIFGSNCPWQRVVVRRTHPCRLASTVCLIFASAIAQSATLSSLDDGEGPSRARLGFSRGFSHLLHAHISTLECIRERSMRKKLMVSSTRPTSTSAKYCTRMTNKNDWLRGFKLALDFAQHFSC